MHFIALQIAKITVNMSYLALFTLYACKKHHYQASSSSIIIVITANHHVGRLGAGAWAAWHRWLTQCCSHQGALPLSYGTASSGADAWGRSFCPSPATQTLYQYCARLCQRRACRTVFCTLESSKVQARFYLHRFSGTRRANKCKVAYIYCAFCNSGS